MPESPSTANKKEGIFVEGKEQASPRLHYAWVIFTICFLMVGCALGFCSSNKSLYLAAITGDLQIPRGLYSICNSCRYVATAVVNLFFGKLIMKLGARKLAFLGFLTLAASCVVSAVANGLAMFYLGGILLGVGLSWTTTTMVGYVVEKWFTGKKGTIMGFILAANGVFGALAAQIMTPIIYSASDAWRKCYWIVTVLMVVIGLLVACFLRTEPQEKGLHPLGEGVQAKKQRGSEWLGITVEEAFGKPYFYVCALCVFLTGMLLQAVDGVATAHLMDRGMSAGVVASAASIYSLCLTASKMLTGISYDKFGLRVTVAACSLCAIVSISILAFVSNAATAYIAMGLTSFAMPMETIMLPLIASECFGRKSFAFIMGLMVSFNTLGYAVGTPIMNYAYDVLGSYTPVMIVLCGLMAVVAVIMQFVISAAHREKKRKES